MLAQRHLEAFGKFRTGTGFLATLSVFLLCWFALNSGLHFDPENFTLNLLLSIEAAYATPLILMALERRTAEESERLKEVLRATHQLLAKLDEIAGEDG